MLSLDRPYLSAFSIIGSLIFKVQYMFKLRVWMWLPICNRKWCSIHFILSYAVLSLWLHVYFHPITYEERKMILEIWQSNWTLPTLLPIPVACFSFILIRNLLGNPLNCNCHLSWLPDYLSSRQIITGEPRCQEPSTLQGTPIQTLQRDHFTCEGEREEEWRWFDDHGGDDYILIVEGIDSWL